MPFQHMPLMRTAVNLACRLHAPVSMLLNGFHRASYRCFLVTCIMTCAVPALGEIVSASAADRRSQAPALAVTSDGTVHAIWFDKGATGEADRKGEKVRGTHHSHQAFADLYYAQWRPEQDGFSPSVRINPTQGQVWGFSISRPVIAVDGAIEFILTRNGTSPETGKSVASSSIRAQKMADSNLRGPCSSIAIRRKIFLR